MNYLAHIYLSGDNHDLMVGNFIADAVKGRQLDKYQQSIQQGIQLHREIDSYTDTHEITRKSKARLFGRYSHYAAVIVDIFYDHYLAVDWATYHDEDLEKYTQKVYSVLNNYETILPEKIKYMLQYMVPQNWLLNYGNLEGIERVLRGMSRRTTFDSGMDLAIEDLNLYYQEFKDDFEAFFPELVDHCDDVKRSFK